MKKITLVLGIIVICMMLKAESCTQKAVNAATKDGQKALVENTTKIPVVFSHFMNIGSSNTIEGKIDLSNAGMGDVVHIDSMTVNVPFKFDIPIKLNMPLSVPVTVNVPWSIILLITVILILIIFPYIMIIWIWRNK